MDGRSPVPGKSAKRPHSAHHARDALHCKERGGFDLHEASGAATACSSETTVTPSRSRDGLHEWTPRARKPRNILSMVLAGYCVQREWRRIRTRQTWPG